MELIQEADRSNWIAHSNHSIKCFTKGDIERMTNNYGTSLGRGAFGEVYQGVLEDQSKVAVKRFISNVKEDFAREFLVHREINHKNVVRLIGYCLEENALMLVTEHMANGNLSDVLHDDSRPIPMGIRLQIAVECAEALAYMHSHMYTLVIHGDIKPGNILLDSNFHAKLSDFGISRLINTDNTPYTENVIGSIGYMDPLFSVDGRLTAKYDVYSFGVVLLELITRKKATTMVDDVNIVPAFTSALARGVRGVREMFDGEIARKNSMKIVEKVAKLAGKCLSMDRDERPEMIDVAECLRLLWKSSHHDQGRQQADLLSWVRMRSSPAAPPPSEYIPANDIQPSDMPAAPPPSAYIPANDILPSEMYGQFSFAEIKVATKNFDKPLCIGKGTKPGRVFCGQFYGQNTNVAIKRYDRWLADEVAEFYTELDMMSKHRHRYLVPLIGYCIDEDVRVLVYGYMAHGSLHDHLHGAKKPLITLKKKKKPLTWKQRLEICIGAARGLCYLHEKQIIHHTISTYKILLDEEWVAKIIGPSLSRSRASIETRWLIGTLGYLDPEYFTTGRFTEKSDVYSFGVVLFEALCARPAYAVDDLRGLSKLHDRIGEITRLNGSNIPKNKTYAYAVDDDDYTFFDIKAVDDYTRSTLVCQVWQHEKERDLNGIIDPFLIGRIDPLSLDKFMEIAWKCVAPEGIDRPSMGHVLSSLEYALQLHESEMARGGTTRRETMPWTTEGDYAQYGFRIRRTRWHH